MAPRRNASSTYSGFNFQTVASISLLIDNINSFSEIRNEGCEDIVIFLENGDVVYAQAKESYHGDNSTTMLRDALITLSEDSNEEKCHQLIYITNVRKMFGAKTIVSDFMSGESISMKLLNEDNLTTLRHYTDQYPGLKNEKLYFQYLRYDTNDENVNRGIKVKMEDFFSSNPAFKNLSVPQVFDRWYLYLNHNASEEDLTITCDRKKIAWGMILYLIDRLRRDLYNVSEANYRVVQSNYESLIDKLTGHFEIISRISGDYGDWISKVPFERRTPKIFAEENWNKYIDILDDERIHEENKPILSKIILQTILDEQRMIRDISKEMKI